MLVPTMAFVFPGQNSHFVGMAKDLHEAGGAARAVLEAADEVLGFPLTGLMFEGPEGELTATQNQQPAILAHSAACLAQLEAQSWRVLGAGCGRVPGLRGGAAGGA
jgi:[acyl-carrier-protein] S-malonyltransferase